MGCNVAAVVHIILVNRNHCQYMFMDPQATLNHTPDFMSNKRQVGLISFWPQEIDQKWNLSEVEVGSNIVQNHSSGL